MNELYPGFLCIILWHLSLYIEINVNMIIRFYQSTISKVCKRSRKPASNANLELQAGDVAKRRSISFEFGINNANFGTKPFKCFKFSIYLLSAVWSFDVVMLFANRFLYLSFSWISCLVGVKQVRNVKSIYAVLR